MRLKGQSVMGLGEFDETKVKKAVLDDMKKVAIYQNAINCLDQGNGQKVDAEVVINETFCVPNCVKKHNHTFQYDYSKCYKDNISERPGECFEENRDPSCVKGTPINIESQMAIK